MSGIHFQPAPNTHPIDATARYDLADNSLIVGPGGEIPPSMHRVSIDTLTFSVRPLDHVVVAFDAYTNHEKWERQALVLPVADQDIALRCTEPFDKHGIAATAHGKVRIIYSQETSVLQLKLGDGPILTRVRCLTCAIYGLGANEELLEIWISLAH